MSGCRHAHHQKKTDIWTKLAAVGEGTASLISDAYWIGGLIDLAAQLDEDGYGLSWYGMGFGTALALITAAGSVYSHTMLNLNHQNEKNHHEEADHETESLINSHPEDHDHHQGQAHSHHHSGRLTWLQRGALTADFISHAGDIAGPITFIAEIVAKERLPWWGKGIIQCSATLFGGVSSIANVRACANSMRELNKKREEARLDNSSFRTA